MNPAPDCIPGPASRPAFPHGVRSAALLGALALFGCEAGPAPAPETPVSPAGAPPEQTTSQALPRGAWFPFTIRGRWDDPRALTYAVAPADGTLSGRQTVRTIVAAIDVWRATGLVDLRRAGAGEEPDVTFSWQRKSHGDARPFGVDRSVAHSGPVRPGTFVHFDAGHTWTERHEGGDARESESLLGAAVHEIGHVLGLGHSPDSRAVLYMDSRAEELHATDLAGLHSLYGGGEDGPGDLVILDRSGARKAVLRRVAPPSHTGWELFDTDGDGDDEVVVWRTDKAGHGALIAFHFRAGPELSLTAGPFISPLLGAATNVEFRTEDDERLVVLTLPDGRSVACPFGDNGQPGSPRAYDGELEGAARGDQQRGDLDGDGMLETVQR